MLAMSDDRNLVINLALSDSETHAVPDKPLEFWKEIAHVGRFAKGDFKFSITEDDLEHWHNTFGAMQKSGIEVPVPVEHTKDPEKRRGKVLALARKTNSKGLPALFARIKFRDGDAAKLSHSGVSIFVPAKAADGYGNEFKAPIQHVAITDYPVLTDLDPFQPIMLSFVGESPGEIKTFIDNEGRKSVMVTPLVLDALNRAREQGLALDFNSKEEADAKKGPPGKSPSQSPSGQGDKPPDRAAPGQSQQENPQQKNAMTLRDLATQLGIDPSITDEQQLLQQLAAIIAQLKARAQAPMPPQMPMRPQMMPGMPGPMMPHPGMQGMGPPGMHTGRPPIQMSFDESKHPRGAKGSHEGGKFVSAGALKASREAYKASDVAHDKDTVAKTGAHKLAQLKHIDAAAAHRKSGSEEAARHHDAAAEHHKKQYEARVNQAGRDFDEHRRISKEDYSGDYEDRYRTSFNDIPSEVLMALSKKQFKELKGLMLARGDDSMGSRPAKKGKKGKGKVSGDKSIVQRLNEESHFGSEHCGDEDEYDDTFKDENNEDFDGGEDNEEENEEMFSGTGKAGKLSQVDGLELSGSVLDLVKSARKTRIDQLFNQRLITAHVRKELEKQYVEAPSVAFSHEFDDGFERVVKLIVDNGAVLPGGKTGPQIAGAAGHRIAEISLSNEENPLLADVQRRAEGKTNFDN